jgi:hypothetical protein
MIALRRSRLVLPAIVVLIGAATVAARHLDVRRISGPVKGDEATYIAMAFSIADDGDLRYERRDYERFVQINRQGPEGIFLKRAHEFYLRGAVPLRRLVPVDEGLTYGKAFIYPFVAAPFAALGGLGGMVIFNVCLLALCLWCATTFCQARMGRFAGGVAGVAFVGASVVPVYVAWLTPELFNVTLVFFAYFLWLYKEVAPAAAEARWSHAWTDVAAALLLGLAAYSKPPIALLAGPLLVGLLVKRRGRRLAVAIVAFTVGSVGLFGINTLVTGEWNYQGSGEPDGRRYFVTHFPFDDQATPFAESGSTMVTNDADTGTVLEPDALRLLPRNAWYFLVGRDAGFVPFFFPGAVLVGVWLVRLRRATFWQWTTFLACAASAVVWLVYAPFTWNGAGGPPGNRYFLSFYPTLLFLVPAGAGWWTAGIAAVGGAAFTGAMVLHPFGASAVTRLNVERAPLRWLPIELTMMDQLPVRLDVLRSRIEFVHDPTVFLYYMDSNTYFAEGNGFWIRGGAAADIVIRTERPLTRVRLGLSSTVPNHVTARFGDRTQQVALEEGGRAWMTMTGDRAGVRVRGSYAYVLHLEAENGFVPSERDAESNDRRYLGVFVKPLFMYGEPPQPLGQMEPDIHGG